MTSEGNELHPSWKDATKEQLYDLALWMKAVHTAEVDQLQADLREIMYPDDHGTPTEDWFTGDGPAEEYYTNVAMSIAKRRGWPVPCGCVDWPRDES